MNVHRSLWLALPFAFLLPLGCNSGETGQEAESSETAAAAAPAPAATTAAAPVVATHAHHHRHARGPARMLFRAARDLDLSDAQRTTIDNLAAQLHGDRTAASSSHQAMRTALAASVRAGNVDPSALAPLQTAAGTGYQAHVQRETTALNGLWAALEPAQRQALVAGVQQRQTERAARWASLRAEGKTGGREQHRLAHLTAKLDLDASQQAAVSGILTTGRPAPAVRQAWHEQMKSRNAALLTAFQSNAFDATTLVTARPAGASAGMNPGQRHLQFLAQLVPILRTDQRETLASSMETAQN